MDCFVALLLAMTDNPHPEEPRSGVSKDAGPVRSLMVRDGAARLLTMRVLSFYPEEIPLADLHAVVAQNAVGG